jgi:hypothetical protein
MPQVEQVKHSSSKKPAVIVAVVAVGAAVLVIVGVMVLMNVKQTPKKQTSVVLNDARDKAFAGKKDQAITQLEAQVKQTSNPDEKLALYMQLGAIYESKGDGKNALAVYQEAGKIQDSWGTNDAIARAAELAGDKALALQYYQKNLKLMKDGKAPEHGQDELKMTQDAIVRLGGTL